MKLLLRLIEKVKKIIYSPEKYAKYIGVQFGHGCRIYGKDHWPSEGYLISIGDDCAITEGVKIHTHGGGRIIRLYCPDYDSFGKVTIGNHVYIGNYAQIMPGVKIEDNVLIAAGSVVTKSIPSGIVVAGNPARYVCTIDEYVNRNICFNTHTKGLNAKKKMEILKNLPDESFITKRYIKI